MNQKTIILGIFGVLGLLAMIGWSWNSQAIVDAHAPKNEKSSLAVSETMYDFGTISMANGNVSHVFKVSNSTDHDIEVKTVETSCMCTNAYIESESGEKGPFGMPGMGHVVPANEIIEAGKSIGIKVVYDPNAHGPAGVGSIDRLVYLTDDLGATLQLEIKTIVTP